jgi:hypothetical protein
MYHTSYLGGQDVGMCEGNLIACVKEVCSRQFVCGTLKPYRESDIYVGTCTQSRSQTRMHLGDAVAVSCPDTV